MMNVPIYIMYACTPLLMERLQLHAADGLTCTCKRDKAD